MGAELGHGWTNRGETRITGGRKAWRQFRDSVGHGGKKNDVELKKEESVTAGRAQSFQKFKQRQLF